MRTRAIVPRASRPSCKKDSGPTRLPETSFQQGHSAPGKSTARRVQARKGVGFWVSGIDFRVYVLGSKSVGECAWRHQSHSWVLKAAFRLMTFGIPNCTYIVSIAVPFFLLLVPSKIRNTNLLTPKTELQWRPQVDPET